VTRTLDKSGPDLFFPRIPVSEEDLVVRFPLAYIAYQFSQARSRFVVTDWPSVYRSIASTHPFTGASSFLPSPPQEPSGKRAVTVDQVLKGSVNFPFPNRYYYADRHRQAIWYPGSPHPLPRRVPFPPPSDLRTEEVVKITPQCRLARPELHPRCSPVLVKRELSLPTSQHSCCYVAVAARSDLHSFAFLRVNCLSTPPPADVLPFFFIPETPVTHDTLAARRASWPLFLTWRKFTLTKERS